MTAGEMVSSWRVPAFSTTMPPPTRKVVEEIESVDEGAIVTLPTMVKFG